MIEKLSDDVLADIKANACNGGMSTEDGIRAFYDAQIDAQAKTIGEMFDIYLELRPDKKLFEYAVDSGLDEESGWSFAEAIALFIAAGGTIKE